MDLIQLYQDYGIDYKTEGNKHCTPGWVNIHCPFCQGSDDYHLGATLNGSVFSCWKCGLHWIDETIAKLLNVNRQAAKKLIIDYAGTAVGRNSDERIVKIRSKAHKAPSNTGALMNAHRLYLLNRGFKPDKLIKEWNLEGTGPVSFLDKINYSRRIFIPIYWEGQQVTFQTRDITDRSELKYLACPEERELIKHKHIIYKHPSFTGDTCICCEGVTDVWRFGRNAVATFGIEYTPSQIRILAKLFKRIAVCFDDEPQAVRQANELIGDLRFRRIDAFRIDIIGDPGGLPQKEADYIVKQII